MFSGLHSSEGWTTQQNANLVDRMSKQGVLVLLLYASLLLSFYAALFASICLCFLCSSLFRAALFASICMCVVLSLFCVCLCLCALFLALVRLKHDLSVSCSLCVLFSLYCGLSVMFSLPLCCSLPCSLCLLFSLLHSLSVLFSLPCWLPLIESARR